MARAGNGSDDAGGSRPLVPAVGAVRGSADGEQPASFWDVFKATMKSPKSEYRESLFTFVRQPCFRESMSWGLGVGTLFAVHRFKQDSTCEAGVGRGE